ncbi:uncharacterized protein LOC143151417 [Ptiloglossa arizonensis]|uniref:uncharacterized protein LOC143151417 n=1 Tax=Ptiloglossa arizonensis TaxID=3350558 RepID=UPI003FA18CDD
MWERRRSCGRDTRDYRLSNYARGSCNLKPNTDPRNFRFCDAPGEKLRVQQFPCRCGKCVPGELYRRTRRRCVHDTLSKIVAINGDLEHALLKTVAINGDLERALLKTVAINGHLEHLPRLNAAARRGLFNLLRRSSIPPRFQPTRSISTGWPVSDPLRKIYRRIYHENYAQFHEPKKLLRDDSRRDTDERGKRYRP